MIIGIGGISRAGKSFLADAIGQLYSKKGKSVRILEQDHYVFPVDQIPRIRDHVDWEVPASIDWPRLLGDCEAAAREVDLLVVEGLLLYSHEGLRAAIDYLIHITLDYETFLTRKRQDLRWGREPEWYIRYIWEAHQEHGQPHRKPDLVLDGAVGFDLKRVEEVLLSAESGRGSSRIRIS